jgi:peptidoglycan hydrolase-like protein with peptidoglycan-binding domain
MDFEHWLQSRLTAHGFPSGPIDGVIGDKTVAALKAFQFAKGLKQTGQGDEATIAALRLSSSEIPASVKAVIPNRDEDPEKEQFQPSKRVWPRQAGVPAFYGAVGTNQTSIDVPFDMFLAWSKSTRVRKITLHKLVADSALKVFQNIAKAYSAEERKALGIDLFGGSLNVRKMRGGSNYSMHSWGIAIDFDPERNQLKWGRDRARLAQPDAAAFWVAWESEGWLSLGRARNFDWMHVQAARL